VLSCSKVVEKRKKRPPNLDRAMSKSNSRERKNLSKCRFVKDSS